MAIRLFVAAFVVGISFGVLNEPACCRGDEDTVEKIQQPQLAKELRARFHSDQAIRNKVIDFSKKHHILDGKSDINSLDPQIAEHYKALVNELEQEDTKNRTWLKEMVRQHGWPGKSLVGSQAASDAWLLVQHADHDREFQQDCLARMEALPKGEVKPTDIAYLTDRILCAAGKKQKYGTQAILKDGKFVPQPIDDEEHVDERRKAIGLEPLSDYLKLIEQVYGDSNEPETQ